MSARDQWPTMENYSEPIFASAHGALTFAFNFSPEQYAPSAMAKMVQSSGNRPPPSRFSEARGGSFVGMHGAGQAGMVLAEIALLGAPRSDCFVSEIVPYILAARFAPHGRKCDCTSPCCSGRRPLPAFHEAIDFITEAAIGQLDGEVVNIRLRRGLVLRFFGERENMTDLSKHAAVSRDIASQHNAKLLPWLKHEDGKAMHAAIARLKERGFVE